MEYRQCYQATTATPASSTIKSLRSAMSSPPSPQGLGFGVEGLLFRLGGAWGLRAEGFGF